MMTPDELNDVLSRYPDTVLVPVSIALLPEVIVEWVECERFRLTPRPDGLHELHVERRVRDKVSA